jgi:hypothetical protein
MAAAMSLTAAGFPFIAVGAASYIVSAFAPPVSKEKYRGGQARTDCAKESQPQISGAATVRIAHVREGSGYGRPKPIDDTAEQI